MGALLGAAAAAAGWLAVAAGVDTPVAPHLGPAVSWLVTLVAVGGTSVFLGVTALVCALAGRWALIARLIVAVGVAAAGCVAVAHGLGAGQEFAPPLVAATFAGATLVIRTLAVPVRAWSWAVVLAGTGAQVVGPASFRPGRSPQPGWAPSPGLSCSWPSARPTAASRRSSAHLVGQLGVTAREVCPAPYAPTWGVSRFTAVDGEGRPLDIDIYGRDAPEGQLLSRLWRFVWVRRSALDLRLRRADHAGHAAGLDALGAVTRCRGPAVVVAAYSAQLAMWCW